MDMGANLDFYADLRDRLMLVVTMYPGQEERVIPCPPHLVGYLNAGQDIPYHRFPDDDEVFGYAVDNGLYPSESDWGTW